MQKGPVARKGARVGRGATGNRGDGDAVIRFYQPAAQGPE